MIYNKIATPEKSDQIHENHKWKSIFEMINRIKCEKRPENSWV